MSLAFPYSFAPFGEPVLTLDEYLDQQEPDFPALRSRAVWERAAAPLTPDNFWLHVAVNTDVCEAGRNLCRRIIEFCLGYIERVADLLTARLQREPGPQQIVEEIGAVAQLQRENQDDEVWMYLHAMEHPVVERGCTNALNNRWGRARLLTPAEAASTVLPDEPASVVPVRRTGSRR